MTLPLKRISSAVRNDGCDFVRRPAIDPRLPSDALTAYSGHCDTGLIRVGISLITVGMRPLRIGIGPDHSWHQAFTQELKDPKEFLETVKVDLFNDEVFVFTPKGDVRSLPRGATPGLAVAMARRVTTTWELVHAVARLATACTSLAIAPVSLAISVLSLVLALASLVIALTSFVIALASLVIALASLVIALTSFVIVLTSFVIALTSLVIALASLVIVLTSFAIVLTSFVIVLTSFVIALTSFVIALMSFAIALASFAIAPNRASILGCHQVPV